MSRLWTPQPRNTNNSRAALDTTPLSEVLRRARTRRQRAPANSNPGRQRTVTSPVTNGVSATTEENSEQTEMEMKRPGDTDKAETRPTVPATLQSYFLYVERRCPSGHRRA